MPITEVPPGGNSNGALHSIVFPLSPPVFVQSDTLIGVCVPSRSDQEALQVVSEGVMDVVNDRLLTVGGSCDGSALPREVRVGQITSVQNVLLHVHGVVGKVITRDLCVANDCSFSSK